MAQTIYQVSQVNAYIKNIFENDYALRQISVRGEVSNCKYNGSGHIYFTLKDETGALSCVMFAGKRASGLHFQLADGQKVIASGSISTYERSGTYQLYASGIVLDGEGDLHKLFEETKKRLSETGMFSPEYKKPIPKYAGKVGVVTAATGAAIQDIINITTRRNPYVQLVLCPAVVQGDGAPASIVRGIERLDSMGLDVIIVGRGGGSIEDLWAFNEEVVARAIFDADTPIISAVGHEIDTTIADFVSDLRAPTPSAAAELAVFDYYAYVRDLEGQKNRLKRHLYSQLDTYRFKLKSFNSAIESRSPRRRLESRRGELAIIEAQLQNFMHNSLMENRHSLAMLSSKLSSMSPLEKIKGGYGYLSDENKKTIKSIRDTEIGKPLSIFVKDGKIITTVTNVVPTVDK